MNNSLFTVGVKFTQQKEDGSFKRVVENFLVVAETFGRAEELIYKEMETLTKSDFFVKGIKRENINTILLNDDDEGTYYEATVSYKDEDDEGAKHIKLKFLVETSRIESVHSFIVNHFRESIAEFKVTGIKLSSYRFILKGDKFIDKFEKITDDSQEHSSDEDDYEDD
jgi:hypothetical protein